MTLSILLMAIMFQFGIIIYHRTGMQAHHRLDHISHSIDNKLATPRLGMHRTQHVASLSFLSEGLKIYIEKYPKHRKKAEELFDKVLTSVLDPNNGYPLYNQQKWKHENLTLSHVGRILYNYEVATGDTKHHALLERIVQHLTKELSQSKIANIRSYRRSTSVWPADNTVMYALIYQYEETFSEVEPVKYERWFQAMKEVGTDSLGLHISELTNNEAYSAVPRGCALSWSCAFMEKYNPEEASILWRTYKKEMKVPLFVLGGFREYDKGRESTIDGDSGPMLFGIGGGATGLALCGSAANGDLLTFYQINNSMKVMETAAWVASIAGYEQFNKDVNGILASCIKFNGDMKALEKK